MAKNAQNEQPMSVKESLILNIRRNQAIIRDNITTQSRKLVVCDEVIALLEKDTDGGIIKFIELSNILQGGPEQQLTQQG